MNDITYAGKHLQTYSVARHQHDAWELVYCTSGHGTFHFYSESDSVPREVSYSEGDIMVIPPFIEHSNVSEEGFTNIHFNIADATLPFKDPLLISDDGERHILDAFRDAFYFFHSALAKKQLLVSTLGNLIVSYMNAYQKSSGLSEVVELIEENIVQNFPDCNYELDEYLKTFPFSYDYLRKLFKRELGVTPHGYLMNKRLETAADLLCSAYGGENNVTGVAHLCGFKEPLYFSRMFKSKYGISPINYIKQNRPSAKVRPELPEDEALE